MANAILNFHFDYLHTSLIARFNCETISYGSLEFVWTEAFPCFCHSNLDKEHITEAGINLIYNKFCPGFSQGQKKAFLSVHLFQNCRVEFFENIIIYPPRSLTRTLWRWSTSGLLEGRPFQRQAQKRVSLREIIWPSDYVQVTIIIIIPSHHDPCSPPGFLVLLYMFAMGVLVVMKRKQKRDRLLREQFLNMPLPTVRRDDDHRGDQDNNDHRLLKDNFFRCKVQNIKRICTNTMQWLNNL